MDKMTKKRIAMQFFLSITQVGFLSYYPTVITRKKECCFDKLSVKTQNNFWGYAEPSLMNLKFSI